MSWAALDEALAQWQDLETSPVLWWRDDDAVACTDELRRLLALTENPARPLGLAVIPRRARAELFPYLTEFSAVRVMQHGYAHRNWAPPGVKKSEFGDGRSITAVRGDLLAGRDALAAHGASSDLFVPPWNRIAEPHLRVLADLGFRLVSGFTGRRERLFCETRSGLIRIDTHVDVIDWRGSRRFVGESEALSALIAALELRRTTPSGDGLDPVGILTHHLVHDDATWRFLERLFARLDRSGVVQWCDVGAEAHR
ncbi:MAG: polysaccharide deacetylase family protein [Pseudomonadota bacterium]